MTILSLLLVLLMTLTGQATTTVKQATFKIEAFGAARAAQDLVSQRLSQATLNTYWDYYDATGKRRTDISDNANALKSYTPVKYGRASDLQFVVKNNTTTPGQELYFQSPVAYSDSPNYQSVQGLLNTSGYFVRYGSDADFRPGPVSKNRWRYRLMQAIEPTEKFDIYSQAKQGSTWPADLSNPQKNDVEPVADNVIAMIVWPRLSPAEDTAGTKLTTDYTYDSKNYSGTGYTKINANQLPPTVQVTFIVIDELSANRLDTNSSAPPAVISSALQGKFTSSSATQYQQDLDDVTKALADAHINYRVFTAPVVLRESKWSESQ